MESISRGVLDAPHARGMTPVGGEKIVLRKGEPGAGRRDQ
jgi:hypothetical protein